MKAKLWSYALVSGIISFLLTSTMTYAADYPKQPITVKMEGAKMAPVAFPHETHVEKQKIACNVCHHKDGQNPKGCATCHSAKEVKAGAPPAKDAFHKVCQDCHKKASTKGVTAPTKCNECHKK